MQKIKKLATMALIAVLSFFGLSAQAEDSLGIGVEVIESTQGDLSMGNRAWFAIEPGASGSSVFRVTSQTDIDQTITYEVFDREFVNGEPIVDSSQLSETANWVQFEPAVASLPARGSREITMTYTIPEDAPEEAFDAVLRVLASSSAPQEEGEGGSRAVVGTAAGIDIDVWLGVGSAVSLLPTFDIREVQGVVLPQGRFLRVEFENLGVVPLSLRGTVQFADPILTERSFDPTTYVSRVIPSGERGYVDVPVIDEITDGNWNVFVSATQDEVRQTRLFEQEIVFAAPREGGISAGAIQVILIGLFSLLTVFGLRKVFRSSSRSEPKPKKPSRLGALISNIRLPEISLPRISLRLPKLPERPTRNNREPKAPWVRREKPKTTTFSENREWANSKVEIEPLPKRPKYQPTPKAVIDEEQLEQAIQRTLLKVLENTAKSSESEDEKPKPKTGPKNKSK